MKESDYPRSILEFQQRFSTEEDCEEYLYKMRWPNRFICPVCGDTEAYYIQSKRAFQCRLNRHQTYLTAGTVMHRTRTPLRYWFWAAYLLTSLKPGISAIQLENQLGINYEVAFQILHKLRASMVNPFRDRITGIVEVDETYIGGTSTGGKRGRGSELDVVIVAVEDKDGRAGRIRMRHIPNVSKRSLLPFIEDSIKKGSTIVTDGFKGYSDLNRYGYIHKPVIQKVSGKESSLPLCHIVISNLKTFIRGTYHGVSPQHLQAYLNEFVFRFNRRFYPMAGFQTILGLSSKVSFPTYKSLYSGKYEHPNPVAYDE
jgi:transposase-like protein